MSDEFRADFQVLTQNKTSKFVLLQYQILRRGPTWLLQEIFLSIQQYALTNAFLNLLNTKNVQAFNLLIQLVNLGGKKMKFFC